VEDSVPSIFRFGRCAEEQGAWQLAADAFGRIRAVRGAAISEQPSISAYHSVLARYHLGRVRERQGNAAAARAEYRSFLDHWGHADRPIREVDEARAALARLGEGGAR